MTDVSTTCAEAKSSQVTLKMASAQVVETSVNNNSPSQDSYHPDDLFQSRYNFYSQKCIIMLEVILFLRSICFQIRSINLSQTR